MKCTISIIFIIFLTSLTCSQWLSDIRLTNDPSSSYTHFGRCIAADGNTLHVIWRDYRNGTNPEIYYKQSLNGGIDWSQDIRLTNDPEYSSVPCISALNSVVHVVWLEARDGNSEIYYKRSTDNGLNWQPDFRLTNDVYNSDFPFVCAFGSFVHVVWQESRNDTSEIYYKHSTDFGASWGPDVRLTFNPLESFIPSISCNNNFIHVVWNDTRDGNLEIYYKRSNDFGNSWSLDYRITNSSGSSYQPIITTNISDIYISWRDNRDGDDEIYFVHSTNDGYDWGNNIQLTFNGTSTSPAICVSGSSLHLVWEDHRDGNDEIYYKASTNKGEIWSGDIRLTNNFYTSTFPSICILGTIVNVVWNDNRNGNYEIYYKRNPNGNIAPPVNSPALISPPNNSNNIGLVPLLDWDSVTNANIYNCQISTDYNFNTVVFDSSVISTQVIVPSGRLNNNTQYFWRVRGANGGGNGPWSVIWNFRTLQSLVTTPVAYEKWISGEKDTIRWSGTNWPFVNIKLTLNLGTPIQSNYTVASNIPNGPESYIWNIPENLLSFRTKITIENSLNPLQKIESNIFRLKPYLLTRTNSDSTYYEYRKDRDQWGFWNEGGQMWPFSWWIQFVYQAVIDPFTGMPYSLSQGEHTFLKALPWQFPDWISWVSTFTVDNCYISLEKAIYSPLALSKWRSRKKGWDGSCFGIAISNALVFRNKSNFYNKFPSFPQFTNPIEIQASDEVRRTVNELFCYQYGQPHINYIHENGIKSVNQTLRELKKMLLSENDSVRILCFFSQDAKGGHAVVPYKIQMDNIVQSKYYLYIYDNAYPQSNSVVIIDTTAYNGRGSWHYEQPPFNDWGGENFFFLMDSVTKYLSNPMFKDQNPVAFSDTILQVTNNSSSSIIIHDEFGRITGHTVDTNFLNIPGSFPLISFNSIRSYPYGYTLRNNHYSVKLTEFLEDTIETYFFTKNRAYTYARNNAIFSHSDFLNFESGISTLNFDSATKTINLSSIIKETSDEKQVVLSELSLSMNDSVKLIELDSNTSKLVNWANQKTYSIKLNFAAINGLGEFEAFNLAIPVNSSHIFIPNWNSLNNSQLVILVDLENNGTIDDTLRIDNQLIGVENGNTVLPKEYALNQNYPNPFNGKTVIVFDIVEAQEVKLSVYDILGREILTLVNNKLNAGRYKAIWSADNFASGIYFYSIKAGNYTATRKMILVK